MGRKHIAVVTPLATGHVYPVLRLCSELVGRGHRVTYPTDERFAGKVRETGAEAIKFKVPEVRYAEKITPSSDASQYWRWFVSIHSPMVIATAAAMVAEVGEFYAANPPDLILYEWFSFAGRILAKHHGCRAIQVCSHFAHHDALMRLDGISATPEPMLTFGHMLDSLMTTYGFSGKGHLWHVEKMNIFLLPRDFQYDADSFDERFIFAGATFGSDLGIPVWKSTADNGSPLLLISENTASRDGSFLDMCVEAFGESRYHVVFSKGMNSPEPCRRVPANFEINREAFNRDILPFANVMLCQGGMGTTLESLYHGVPVVAIPPNPFNSEVAYRVAELGLGIHIQERGMTPSVLRQAVDAASLDEELRRRSKLMQSTLRTERGAETAANAIDKVLSHTEGRVE